MPKERRAVRIESAGQKIERDAAAVFAQHFRIAHTGQRMIIRDEIKRFALGLQRDGRPHHAEIIPDVQRAARLNTGKNPPVFFLCHVERVEDLAELFKSAAAFNRCQRNSLCSE